MQNVSWIPTLYNPRDRANTDFGLLARKEPNTLFIFNDNEEQFPAGTARGGGNACVRPLRGLNPPRAAGIPTGTKGRGYSGLTSRVRRIIDKAFAIIDSMVASNRFTRVRYSCSKDDPFALGTSIFHVDATVLAYIREHIRRRAQSS